MLQVELQRRDPAGNRFSVWSDTENKYVLRDAREDDVHELLVSIATSRALAAAKELVAEALCRGAVGRRRPAPTH